MIRWLYSVVLTAALPGIFLRLLWRSIRLPGYRRRWRERLGLFPPPARRGGIWFHAVSVGEVQAVVPLVNGLLNKFPDLPVTITTTTPTGSERVRISFPDDVFHVYIPYDLPFALRSFLDRVGPCMLVIVETEIWPNLLAMSAERGIPSVLANARLSARSAHFYARLGGFTRATLGKLALVVAQAPVDARRFKQLGVPEDRLKVTGSIKFDVVIPSSVAEQTRTLRRQWGGERPVWVAASTHEGEDQILLEAHHIVLRQMSNAMLVLAPRHPERFDRVAALCERRGITMARRSKARVAGSGVQVLVLDTMGELLAVLGAADAAFIGGSLVPVGGHNMLEAAAQGVPVAFGPHTYNFATITELLLSRDAAVQVADADSLGARMRDWLSDPNERSRIGQAGKRVVTENRGALSALSGILTKLVRDHCQ